MPLYEYKCFACDYEFTRSLPMANNKLPEQSECPHCGAGQSVKQIISSAPAFGDGVRLGVRRPDGGMREVLQRIDSRTPGSRLKEVSNLTRM